jgi:hypothetical protein
MAKRTAVLLAFFGVALVAGSATAGPIVAPDLGIAEPGVTDLAAAPAAGVSFSDLGVGDSTDGEAIARFIPPQEYTTTFASRPEPVGGFGRLRRGRGASAPLPEPGTLLLLGSGLAALTAGRRLRR